MALDRYTIKIEENDVYDGYHPLSVYVHVNSDSFDERGISREIFETHGKKLMPLLRKAIKAIDEAWRKS